ncbi:MAG: S-layer homology domain-containing protein [Clostridia bacterium]|nr:S-layer homology domain-containing protein [Clostridia bacterium]
MSKKFLSLVMAFAMLLGMFQSVSAFNIAEDVKGTDLETTAAVLGSLNIMTGDADTGNFRPDDSIKRSEVARVAISELGLESVALGSEGSSKFADVPLTHWGLGYINVAASRSLVVGDDGVHFRPDDPITISEAAVIFTKMLGYDPKADAAGGYPTGYMITAENIGLFEGVSQTSGNATRSTIAKMAENALEIKMMEQTGYGSNVQFEVTDKTILKDTLNVEKLYGQVTGNKFTRLNGTSSLKDNQVEIDGKIYKDVTGQATSLLGYQVMYLAKTNNNTSRENEVIMAVEDANAMDRLEIDGENVVSFTGDTSKKLEYWRDKQSDSKTKIANIAEDAKLIYNSKAADFDKNLIKPESGTITGVIELIDSNRDDVFDIISVIHYENYVVDSTSEASHKIYDKYDKGFLTLDPDDSDIKFSLTKGGADIKFSDLKEWDVLSVAKSLDGSAITVKVSEKSVEGTVTEKSKEYVYIDGEKYKVAENYTETISIDDTGRFYLDNYGRIAAVDATKRFASNYAYLYDAYEADAAGKKITFDFMTTDGKLESVNGADKMTLDGVSSKTAKEVLASLKNESGKIVPQVITYELNDKGNLKTVDLAENMTDGRIDEKQFTINADAKGLEYKASVNKLGKYNVSASTLIFDIPEGSSESDYSVKKRDMLIDGSKYDVKMYDVTDSMTATIMVITNSAGVISGENNIAVVDSLSTVMNSDKEKVERLYAYVGGKRIGVNSKSLDYFVKGEDRKPLEQGDIIRYSTNSAGEVDRFEVLMNVSEKTTEFSKDLDSDTTIVYGKVEKKFSGSINVSVNGANTANYATGGATVYSYDSSKVDSEISVVTPDDIQKYDEADAKRVFLKIYKDEVKEIVIVK